VRIYRTEGGGSDFYFLADVTSGNAYVDKIADASLDDTTIPQSDNYPAPVNARAICIHQDRLILGRVYDGSDWHHQRIQWSLAGYPDIFPLNNYADTPSSHGDVTGLVELNGQLYVFMESAIARLTLHGASDNVFEIVTTAAGCASLTRESLVVGMERDHEVAFFMAADGLVYAFDGTGVRNISEDVRERLESVTTIYAAAQICAGWDGRSYHIFYKPSGDSYGTILRYDTLLRKPSETDPYGTGTWWPQQLENSVNISGMARFGGGEDEGALYFCTHTNGFVYKFDSGDDDDGTNIDYYFYTGYHDCGDAGIEKYFDSMAIDCASTSSLTVTWDTDWGDATNNFTTKEQADPIRTYHDPAGRTNFRYIRVKVEGSDGDAPSTVYALMLRVGADRPSRKHDQ